LVLGTLETGNWISQALCKQGNLPGAIRILRDIYEKQLERQDPDETLILKSAGALAHVLNQSGEYTEAVVLCEEQSLRLKEVPLPTDLELIAKRLIKLTKVKLEHGKALLGLKKKKAAEHILRYVVEIRRMRKNEGDDDDDETKGAAALLESCRC